DADRYPLAHQKTPPTAAQKPIRSSQALARFLAVGQKPTGSVAAGAGMAVRLAACKRGAYRRPQSAPYDHAWGLPASLVWLVFNGQTGASLRPRPLRVALVLGEAARGPVRLGRVAAARAVQRSDVLERDQDVAVELDVRDLVDGAVGGQDAVVVVAAEHGDL